MAAVAEVVYQGLIRELQEINATALEYEIVFEADGMDIFYNTGLAQ